ncbi:MAG: beta-propeller fold lactonase family protein [Panacibacter sp.]
MKQTKGLLAFAISMMVFGACQKDIQNSKAANTSLQAQSNDDLLADGEGHVFILSNQVSGNEVLAYKRAADGTITYGAAYATGGTGTGGGLGNQGAVIISQDKQYLLAVNPGSSSISSLRITNSGLELLSTVSSGGTQPVSITQHDGMVYVLNSGGDGNISGFWFNGNGTLSPITNSTKPLSAIAAGAAQISFVEEGKVLVITEKATNTITTYTIKNNGTPGVMHTLASSNPTPFGFAVGRNNIIYVSEAVGGALGASTLSSYFVAANGAVKLLTGPVGAFQSAACWVALTSDGKYAYTTNTASNNLSTFKISGLGNIKVAAGIAALSGLGPIDADIDGASKYLYVLNGGSHSISAYTIGTDAVLANLQTTEGLPVGATGLAAE